MVVVEMLKLIVPYKVHKR